MFFNFREILKGIHCQFSNPLRMRINPTAPSSSQDNPNDSLGIVFNEHKITDTDGVPYKSPTPVTPPAAPLKNISSAVPVKTFETSFLDGGTIITDKRKRRATLGENLNSAFTEWWGNTKQKLETTLATVEHSLKEGEQEKPVVENPETRADTIRKAAAYTMQAPKDDHAIVTEKIATVQHESIPLQTKPIIIKEVSSHKEPQTWAPAPRPVDTAPERQSAPRALSLLEISNLKKTAPSYAPPQSAAVTEPTPRLTLEDSRVAETPTPTPTTPEASTAGTDRKEFTENTSFKSDFTATPWATAVETISPTPPQEESHPEVAFTPAELPPLVQTPTEIFQAAPVVALPTEPEIFTARVIATPEEPLEEAASKPVSHFFEPETKSSTAVSQIDADMPETELFSGEDVTQQDGEQAFTSEATPDVPVFTVEPVAPATQTPFDTPTPLKTPEKYTLPSESLHGTSSQEDDEPIPHPAEKLSAMPVFLPTVSQNNSLRTVTRWAIIFGIVLLGVGLAIFASTKFNIFEEDVTPPVVVAPIFIPTLFKTDTQAEIALSSDKTTFLSELVTRVATAPSGVSQFYPVAGIDSERHSATAEEIFTTLNTRMGSKTIRSFEDTLILGGVTTQKNEPFMVLHSFNFDTLFSGLLAWEPSLMNDMSPFFGAAPTATSKFTDATLHNKPTRILHDAMGNEILLYSFANQSTVIITTSRAALALILEKF